MNRDNGNVDLSLEPPSTYIFTIEQCTKVYKLNTFSLDIKRPEIRERFLESGRELMTEYGLTEHEIDMVERRDWRAWSLMGVTFKRLPPLPMLLVRAIYTLARLCVAPTGRLSKNHCLV